MGITNVNLKVSNLKDESRFIEENFLVDSGARLVLDPFKRQLFEAKLFL